MKISKNMMLLTGAIGLGVISFIGANYYLRSYLSEAEAKLLGAYSVKKIIVAREPIPAGSVLTMERLAFRSMPVKYVSSTMVPEDQKELVLGQKAMVAMEPGDAIDRGGLERADRAPLSMTVSKGERAITFPVDEISSISGMLVPGDIIDLFYTGPGKTANSYTPSPTGGEPAAKDLLHVRLILQAVPVMATGKTTQRRVVRTEDGNQHEVNMNFNTVTLNVGPSQAEKILLAQKLGQLTAVLRNPEDKAVIRRTVLDEASFKQVAAAPRVAANRYIETIVGGSGAVGGMHSKTVDDSSPAAASSKGAPLAKPAPSTASPAPSARSVKDRLGISAPSAPVSPVVFIPTKP